MIKKFFGAILLLIIFSQNVSAERIDRVDEQFDFQSIHRVIVLDATVGDNLSYGGMVGLRGLQNTFRDVCTNTLNRDCIVYSEFAAMQILGENLKINLLRLSIASAGNDFTAGVIYIADNSGSASHVSYFCLIVSFYIIWFIKA